MPILFYISSAVAIVATIMVITRYHPIHALLYLVVSFLGSSNDFFITGRALRCCAGNNPVCRSHYSAVDFCGNDAESWNRYRSTGKTMAAAQGMDRSFPAGFGVVRRN